MIRIIKINKINYEFHKNSQLNPLPNPSHPPPPKKKPINVYSLNFKKIIIFVIKYLIYYE